MRHLIIVLITFIALSAWSVKPKAHSYLRKKNPAQHEQNAHQYKQKKNLETIFALDYSPIQFQNKISHHFLLVILLGSIAVNVAAELEHLEGRKDSPNYTHHVVEQDGVLIAQRKVPEITKAQAILDHIPNGISLAQKIDRNVICERTSLRLIFQDELGLISKNSQFEYLGTGPLKPCQAIIIHWGEHSLLWHHSHDSCLAALDEIYEHMGKRFGLEKTDPLKVTIYTSEDRPSAGDYIWEKYKERGFSTNQAQMLLQLRSEVAKRLSIEENQIMVILAPFDEIGVVVDRDGEIHNILLPHKDPAAKDDAILSLIWDWSTEERYGQLPKGFRECRRPYNLSRAIILEKRVITPEVCTLSDRQLHRVLDTY